MIEVKNASDNGPTCKVSQFEEGVLYKTKTLEYSTIYTKIGASTVIWFEQGRSGLVSLSDTREYVKAPKGTEVLLKN